MCHPDRPDGGHWPSDAAIAEHAEISELTCFLSVTGEVIPSLQASPRGAVGGTVLMISDIFGRTAFYEALAGRLAMHGYRVILPDFFFRQGPLPEQTEAHAFARRERLDQQQAVTDLNQMIDRLQTDAPANQRVGTMGFCLGGTFALCLAANRTDLATTCFYGFPAGGRVPGNLTPPLALADQMTGPILGFWGDQDAGVGMDNVRQLDDLMRTHKIDFQHTVYPDAGHGFMSAGPGDPEHSADLHAAEDSWTQTLAFFASHLACDG